MGRLNNAEFLKQANGLLAANGGASLVYLTQKRLSLASELGPKEPMADLSSNVADYGVELPENTEAYPVLIRLSMNDNKKTARNKTKISTVVEVAHLDQFWVDYTLVLKNGFVGLKRKDKKKTKKPKVAK